MLVFLLNNLLFPSFIDVARKPAGFESKDDNAWAAVPEFKISSHQIVILSGGAASARDLTSAKNLDAVHDRGKRPPLDFVESHPPKSTRRSESDTVIE
jgi:hypothetical protein